MRLFTKILLLSASLLLIGYFIVSSAHAQYNPDLKKEYNDFLSGAGLAGTYDPSQASDTFIESRIGFIIALLISFIALFFLIMVIYSGFQWMTASGNEEKVEEAKKRVINGTIGVILTLAAFTITSFIYNYFDSKFLKPPEVVTPPTKDGNVVACASLDKSKCMVGNNLCAWINNTCVLNTSTACTAGCIDDNIAFCLEQAGTCVECLTDHDCGAWYNPTAMCSDNNCWNK